MKSGKNEGRDGEQDSDNHRSAHDVAEQTHGQCKRTRELADDVERQHDPRRLQVGLEVTAQALVLDTEERHGDKDRDRQCRRGRQRTGRCFVSRDDRTEVGHCDKEKQRAQKTQILGRMVEADFLDLFFNGGDDDFEEALPPRDMYFGHELARDQPRAQRHHDHQPPRRDDRAIELDKAVPPENQIIGRKAQWWSPLPVESALQPARV